MKLLPEKFVVYPNYPNPFNANTEIRLDLPQKADVDYKIFDLLGRSIFESNKVNFTSGRHRIFWDGKSKNLNDVGSGVYFIQIRVGEKVHIQKMLLIK